MPDMSVTSQSQAAGARVSTMKKVEVIIRPGKLEAVRRALETTGHSGITVSQAEGQGKQRGVTHQQSQGATLKLELVPKTRLEIVVSESDLEPVIKAIMTAAQTGQVGDGKIFVSDIRDVIRIRTGERGASAV